MPTVYIDCIYYSNNLYFRCNGKKVVQFNTHLMSIKKILKVPDFIL